MPERVAKKVREAVFARAEGRCEYCRTPAFYSPSPYDVEHIFPKSLGGTSRLDNLALSCGGCNGLKSNKIAGIDPIDFSETPLFNPRTDAWREHFAWASDATQIIGISPRGRATVELLQLNRPALMRLRSALILTGEHPPD